MEATLSDLKLRGLVMEGSDRRFERYGKKVFGIPHELGEGLVQRRREKLRGIFSHLTLRGYLCLLYTSPSPRDS